MICNSTPIGQSAVLPFLEDAKCESFFLDRFILAVGQLVLASCKPHAGPNSIRAFYLYTLNSPISLSDACRPDRQLWQLRLQYERVPHPLWQRPHRSQGNFEILSEYWFKNVTQCYFSPRISFVNWSWWDIIPFIFCSGWYNLDLESWYVCWKIILSETSFTCGDHIFQILSKLGSPIEIKR